MGKSKLEKFYELAVLYPFMRWPDVATGRVQERHRETKCVVLTGPRETKSIHALREPKVGRTKECAPPDSWAPEREGGGGRRWRERDGVGPRAGACIKAPGKVHKRKAWGDFPDVSRSWPGQTGSFVAGPTLSHLGGVLTDCVWGC